MEVEVCGAAAISRHAEPDLRAPRLFHLLCGKHLFMICPALLKRFASIRSE